MQSYPIGAPVACSDGVAGISTHVIVNPLTRAIASVVVKESEGGGVERVVPVARVASSTAEGIQLDCTRAELAVMQPFVEREYTTGLTQRTAPISTGPGGGLSAATFYMPYGLTTSASTTSEVDRLNIPEGMLAINRGMKVKALDGEVGEVDELLVNPESGQVTHFVLREGNVFGKKELALPLSAVDGVDDDTVRLKLDKDAVRQLPAVASKRLYYGGPDVIHFVAVTFDFEKAADEVLFKVQERGKQGALFVLGGARIRVNAKGKSSQKAINPSARRSRRVGKGLLIGGLAAVLLPGVGLAVGALIGGLAGAATAPGLAKGLPPEMFEKVQAALKPDTSALVLLVEERWMDALTPLLSDFDGKIIDHVLSDEIVEELIAQAETEQAKS
jgi:uncharacterized membrane protein